MNIRDVVAAVSGANYLVLSLMVAVYVRKLLSSASRFPVTLPVNWRPSVVAAASLVWLVLTARQGGAAWGSAALEGAIFAGSTGFLDGLIVAIFGAPEAAPVWARWAVFLVDDVTAGGSSGSPPGPTASAVDISEVPTVPGFRAARAGAIALAVAVMVLMIAMATISGCSKPSATPTTRGLARAELLSLADAVRVAEVLCADTARDYPSPELARRCADGADRARAGLAAGNAAIDAYDAGSAGDVACNVRDAVEGLGDMATALDGLRIDLPPAVTDALTLARALGEVCRG